MDGPDAVVQIPGPASNLTSTPTQSVLKIPVLTARPATGPVRDEWDTLRLVPMGLRRHFLSAAPLVKFFRRDPAARAFDRLRTNLLQTLRANRWHRVAIAAPTSECGATFTAVNLAQSLSRVAGSRTVLMDANHRSPGIAEMLDLDCSGDMRAYLEGEMPLDQHLIRASQTLALGLISKPDPEAAEILLDARCARVLSHMTDVLRPDVVLYDLPPILAHDDLSAFLPQVDAVLLVADGTQTSPADIAACKRILDGQVPLLGVVLNRARKSGLQGYG